MDRQRQHFFNRLLKSELEKNDIEMYSTDNEEKKSLLLLKNLLGL